MDRNHHHAKFSIAVSAASLNLEIIHILGCGFCCNCARTPFSYAVHVLHLLMGRGQPQRVLHTYSNILQSGYDGWYLQQPCCDLFFFNQ
jgi:hypothetical protein